MDRYRHQIGTWISTCIEGNLRLGEGGGGNQAYSLLSTTHGHITNCKMDSVVYAGVCMVI